MVECAQLKTEFNWFSGISFSCKNSIDEGHYRLKGVDVIKQAANDSRFAIIFLIIPFRTEQQTKQSPASIESITRRLFARLSFVAKASNDNQQCKNSQRTVDWRTESKHNVLMQCVKYKSKFSHEALLQFCFDRRSQHTAHNNTCPAHRSAFTFSKLDQPFDFIFKIKHFHSFVAETWSSPLLSSRSLSVAATQRCLLNVHRSLVCHFQNGSKINFWWFNHSWNQFPIRRNCLNSNCSEEEFVQRNQCAQSVWLN